MFIVEIVIQLSSNLTHSTNSPKAMNLNFLVVFNQQKYMYKYIYINT